MMDYYRYGQLAIINGAIVINGYYIIVGNWTGEVAVWSVGALLTALGIVWAGRGVST